MKQQGMIGKRWIGGTVLVLGVALLVVGMTVHAYPQPSEEEDRAERERDGFDTDAIRQRMGIDAMGNPIPAEALDGIVESATGLREARPQPERSVIGARDSTGVGIMGSGNPRAFERNQCTASGGDWDSARNQCSYARLTCEEMGFNWSGSSCDPGDFGGGGGGGNWCSVGNLGTCNNSITCMNLLDTERNMETDQECTVRAGRWAERNAPPACTSTNRSTQELQVLSGSGLGDRTAEFQVCNWGGSFRITSESKDHDCDEFGSCAIRHGYSYSCVETSVRSCQY